MTRTRSDSSSPAEDPRVTLWSVFIRFLRIGFVTIGGGYAMIPVIEHELITRRHLFPVHEFNDLFAIAQSLPGPIAVNVAALVGYRLRRIPGAIISVAGVILAPFATIVTIALVLGTGEQPAALVSLFTGLRIVVVALIAAAGMRLVVSSGKRAPVVTVAAGAMLALLFLTSIHPALIIVLGMTGGAAAHGVTTWRRRDS